MATFATFRSLSFRDICTRFAPPRTHDFRTLWNVATPDPAPDCLLQRGIDRKTLAVYRPMIRCDEAGRGLFAHCNSQRTLTGFEISPPDKHRRFATGGTRSLFALHAGSANTLTTLVITEGAVNASSLAQINHCPTDHAFLSTAGAPGAAQRAQIVGLVLAQLSADEVPAKRLERTFRDWYQYPNRLKSRS